MAEAVEVEEDMGTKRDYGHKNELDSTSRRVVVVWL